MRVLIAGDYVPSGRVYDCLIHDRVKEVIPEEVVELVSSADFSLVNFECPVVVSPQARPIAKCGPNLKTSPIGVEAILQAGFKGVTLANNHFRDYGDEGVNDTITCCKARSLAFLGGGGTLRQASMPLRVWISGRNVTFINACEHEFSIATEFHGGSNPLNPILQYYDILEAKKHQDFVIVIVHGGHEHFNLPSPRMQETYRFFIDAGADAVFNHHQHCYSGYEVYKGKPIFYGLGNFLFDHPYLRNCFWNEGYMVELSLDDLNIEKPIFRIIPYSQCNGNSSVELMEGNEYYDFISKVKQLNAVIADPSRLSAAHKEYMNKSQKGYKEAFTPYSGRLLRAVWHRGLLPSFLSKKKIAVLLDYIDCEAHRERTINMLYNELN